MDCTTKKKPEKEEKPKMPEVEKKGELPPSEEKGALPPSEEMKLVGHEEIRQLETGKVEELEERLVRLQADFENYRKRVEKEVQEAVQRSNEQLVACLINIIDDLESAIAAGETTENKDALLEGIKMVHKNLEKLLEQEDHHINWDQRIRMFMVRKPS